MSGTLLELDDTYDYGVELYDVLCKEMLDGKPICCRADLGLLALMISHAKGDHLEIGSAYGGSLLATLRFMDLCGRDGKVVCIEPFGEDRRDTIHKAVEKEFWRNIDHFGVRDRIEHIKAFSHPFPVEPGRRFGSAFIDGDHSYKWVLRDWNNTKDIVDDYIMFHDYGRETVREVVVNHAAPDPDWILAAVHGWSAVMKRNAESRVK